MRDDLSTFKNGGASSWDTWEPGSFKGLGFGMLGKLVGSLSTPKPRLTVSKFKYIFTTLLVPPTR